MGYSNLSCGSVVKYGPEPANPDGCRDYQDWTVTGVILPGVYEMALSVRPYTETVVTDQQLDASWEAREESKKSGYDTDIPF